MFIESHIGFPVRPYGLLLSLYHRVYLSLDQAPAFVHILWPICEMEELPSASDSSTQECVWMCYTSIWTALIFLKGLKQSGNAFFTCHSCNYDDIALLFLWECLNVSHWLALCFLFQIYIVTFEIHPVLPSSELFATPTFTKVNNHGGKMRCIEA